MLWTNNAIVLSARSLGEGKAIASLLSEDHGGYRGVVPGGNSGKRRHLLQPGTLVNATWRARVPEQLGVFSVELLRALDTGIIHHRLRLAILMAACSLLDTSLPEREPNPGLYQQTLSLLAALATSHDLLGAYADWELSLVAALGFGSRPRTLSASEYRILDDDSTLAGSARHDRQPAVASPEGLVQLHLDVVMQLRSTLTTLETHVFAGGRHGVPAARHRLTSLIETDRRGPSMGPSSERGGCAANQRAPSHDKEAGVQG